MNTANTTTALRAALLAAVVNVAILLGVHTLAEVEAPAASQMARTTGTAHS
jgi:hypothetical protein